MKIFRHILIIVFVVLCLFLIKDDIKQIASRVYSYLNKNAKIENKLVIKTEELLGGTVDTPGALRIVNNILDSDSKLSKDKIIEFTNLSRKENGNLKALVENEKLNLSAEKKLQDMFDKQYFEHVSPGGVGVADLGSEVGYEYILIGENLALGNFKDDKALVDAWMASPGHRANILNSHYSDIGVAVGKGKFENRNTWIAVQHFGTPKSVCPSIDKVLLGVINVNQSNIKKMESDLIARKAMIDKKAIYEGSTYSEQIDIYNNLVNIYNKLIIETKQKINNYNNQIKEFNFCLSNNQ